MIITFPGQPVPPKKAFQRQTREYNPENQESGLLLYQNRKVLLGPGNAGSWTVPAFKDLLAYREHITLSLQIGTWHNHTINLGAWKGEELPDIGPYTWVNLRSLFAYPDASFLGMIGFGNQMLHWDMNTQFCGRCGSRHTFDAREGGKICPNCGHKTYTRISPAVIVAVIKEGKILLAQSPRHRGKFHTVLAGFVEPGESLEETVLREIKEEVNIEVGNIRYFGSQSWPFPDSLMVGYFADYQGGELMPDMEEISEADWYGPDEIPIIPPPASIAHHLIQAFVEEFK